MAQGVHRRFFVDTGGFQRLAESDLNAALAYRRCGQGHVFAVAAGRREYPDFVFVAFPLFTQKRQGLFGQGYVTVFATHVALGISDLDKSTGAVDIFDFQMSAGAQSVGFALFIFSVGYQAGPRFFDVLRTDGLKYCLLAVVVAFVGVLSALMALQLERVREFGVLRANGLTPGQVWSFPIEQL